MRRSPWSTCSTGWRRATGGCGMADCGASDVRLGVATLASRFMRLQVRCARRGRTARNECLAAILAEVGDGRKRGRHGQRRGCEKMPKETEIKLRVENLRALRSVL